MSLADIVPVVVSVRLSKPRKPSNTPQARWNRENVDRLRIYKRAWRARQRNPLG